MDGLNGLIFDDNEVDPFALNDLWRPSVFTGPDLPSSSSLFSHVDEKSSQIVLGPQISLGLSLPELGSFTFGNSNDRASPLDAPDKTAAAEVETGPSGNCNLEDIWREPHVITSRATCRKYHCWEASLSEALEFPETSYATEAGPGAFDAILASTIVSPGPEKILEPTKFLRCLHYLGLGQSSVLFAFDEQSRSFHLTLPDARPSGYSSASAKSLIEEFLQYGNKMRRLREITGTSTFQCSPATAKALADAVSAVTSALQMHLSVDPASVNTIIELQRLFQRPMLALNCMDELVSAASGLDTDSAVLESINDTIQQLEYKTIWIWDTLQEILSRVSHPWLAFIESWIGLQRPSNLTDLAIMEGKMFVRCGSDSAAADVSGSHNYANYYFDPKLMPSFVHEDESETIFESGRGLRLLMAHYPNHPLARSYSHPMVETPSLRWKVTWDIECVEKRAKRYEHDLMKAIREYSNEVDISCSCSTIISTSAIDAHADSDVFGQSKENIQAKIAESAALFDRPMVHFDRGTAGDLREVFLRDLRSESDTEDDSFLLRPPLSSGPLLSFYPIILAQSRLINASCLRMLFKEYDLRFHLSVLRRYQLLGDSLFSSRLSQALFDPDLKTTERKRGVALSGGMMGLKLGSRKNWPPASSELRLALMGILTETLHASDPAADSSGGGYLGRGDDLPGGLSFAVRSMPTADLERIMDPSGIEALDFLRIHYKPPWALESVIDEASLDKYDRVFKLLLRVLRVLFIVNQLKRHIISRIPFKKTVGLIPRRFSFEAHHFITSIFAYFLEVAIDTTWRKFEGKLADIEQLVDQGSSITDGIHKLRQYHERTLNRIMFSLLLRKRQEDVMELLTSIFSTVLKFEALFNSTMANGEGVSPRENEISGLYSKFQKQVSLFVTICRGLSERKGYGERKADLVSEDDLFGADDKSEDGGNSIRLLMLRLDMNSYYSTRRR